MIKIIFLLELSAAFLVFFGVSIANAEKNLTVTEVGTTQCAGIESPLQSKDYIGSPFDKLRSKFKAPKDRILINNKMIRSASESGVISLYLKEFPKLITQFDSSSCEKCKINILFENALVASFLYRSPASLCLQPMTLKDMANESNQHTTKLEKYSITSSEYDVTVIENIRGNHDPNEGAAGLDLFSSKIKEMHRYILGTDHREYLISVYELTSDQ